MVELAGPALLARAPAEGTPHGGYPVQHQATSLERLALRFVWRLRDGSPARAARLRGAPSQGQRHNHHRGAHRLRPPWRLRARARRGRGRGHLRAAALRPEVRGEDGGRRLPRGTRAAGLPHPRRERRGRRQGLARAPRRRVRGPQGVSPRRRRAAHPLEERRANRGALRQGVRGRGAAPLRGRPGPAPGGLARPRGGGRGRRLGRSLGARPPRARSRRGHASRRVPRPASGYFSRTTRASVRLASA